MNFFSIVNSKIYKVNIVKYYRDKNNNNNTYICLSQKTSQHGWVEIESNIIKKSDLKNLVSIFLIINTHIIHILHIDEINIILDYYRLKYPNSKDLMQLINNRVYNIIKYNSEYITNNKKDRLSFDNNIMRIIFNIPPIDNIDSKSRKNMFDKLKQEFIKRLYVLRGYDKLQYMIFGTRRYKVYEIHKDFNP